MSLTPEKSLCVGSNEDKIKKAFLQGFLLENLKDYPFTVKMLERRICYDLIDIKKELRTLLRNEKVIPVGIRECMETGYQAQYYSASRNMIDIIGRFPGESKDLIFDLFVRYKRNPYKFHYQETGYRGGYHKSC